MKINYEKHLQRRQLSELLMQRTIPLLNTPLDMVCLVQEAHVTNANGGYSRGLETALATVAVLSCAINVTSGTKDIVEDARKELITLHT